MVKVKDGFIEFNGFKTYYKIVGLPSKLCPLLVLHGGPGSAHNYMLGLSEVAKTGRQVVFYDQLGCGKSDRPADDSLWEIQLFVDELRAIRKNLGLSDIHLIGHSWGGMLAIDYMLSQPKGVKSLILASSMISLPLYQKEVEKIKQILPPNVYATLKKHEQAGTTDSLEYKKAYDIYKNQYLFRGKKRPKQLSSPAGSNGDASYRKMWGVSESYANGTMKSWDRVNRLHEIKVPTLVTSGQYDELTPWQAGITRDNIPNSKIKTFTNGSHLVHIEQPKEYIETIVEFLADVEK